MSTFVLQCLLALLDAAYPRNLIIGMIVLFGNASLIYITRHQWMPAFKAIWRPPEGKFKPLLFVLLALLILVGSYLLASWDKNAQPQVDKKAPVQKQPAVIESKPGDTKGNPPAIQER